MDDLELLNTSPASHPLDELTSTEETKLRYRFLDLRTERMQRALRYFFQFLLKAAQLRQYDNFTI